MTPLSAYEEGQFAVAEAAEHPRRSAEELVIIFRLPCIPTHLNACVTGAGQSGCWA